MVPKIQNNADARELSSLVSDAINIIPKFQYDLYQLVGFIHLLLLAVTINECNPWHYSKEPRDIS